MTAGRRRLLPEDHSTGLQDNIKTICSWIRYRDDE